MSPLGTAAYSTSTTKFWPYPRAPGAATIAGRGPAARYGGEKASILSSVGNTGEKV